MSKRESKKAAIASRLRIAREEAGLSQGQVAKLLDLQRPSVSEMEAGRRNVTVPELAKLAEIYGVSVSWLACEDTSDMDPVRDRIELAARELSKLKPEDMQRVLRVLKTLRQAGGSTA